VSRTPLYHLRYPKYHRAKILLGALRKISLLVPVSPGFHPLPYREDVRNGHSRRRHARRRVNRVIVGTDKFWENDDIFVGIFVGEILIQPIANRSVCALDDASFNFGIHRHLKLNTLAFQHRLEVFI